MTVVDFAHLHLWDLWIYVPEAFDLYDMIY